MRPRETVDVVGLFLFLILSVPAGTLVAAAVVLGLASADEYGHLRITSATLLLGAAIGRCLWFGFSRPRTPAAAADREATR